MIKTFFLIFAAGLLLGRIAPTQAQTGFWHCPQTVEGQSLSVYNWTTYIAEDTISNFERLCGVTVNYNTYAGDDEMLEELRAGNPGYDVVVPTDATVYLLIEEELLQPLNFNNIPNIGNLDRQFENPPYDPQNLYTVPYQWGTVGVGYNRTALGRDLTSWSEVFDADASVAWLDEDRAMLGFALSVLGNDPNTADAAQITAAAQYLIERGDNVSMVAPDTGQDLLAAGEVDIAVEYSGDIFQIIADCACDDFAYLIPQEGALLWIDSLAIPVGARNKLLAEVFIDYLLTAQVAADISNYTAYASPNSGAIDEGLISSDYLNNLGIYPDDAVREALFFSVSNAAIEPLYDSAWETVKAAVED